MVDSQSSIAGEWGRRVGSLASALLFTLVVGACQDQSDCRLSHGGVGHFAHYPQDIPIDEVPDRAEYTALVNVSRAQSGSVFDYGEKRFQLRVWPTGSAGEGDILDECLALFAGKYEIEFEWEQPSELKVLINFENAQGIAGHLENTFHLSPEAR